jgi:hypothetical protein
MDYVRWTFRKVPMLGHTDVALLRFAKRVVVALGLAPPPPIVLQRNIYCESPRSRRRLREEHERIPPHLSPVTPPSTTICVYVICQNIFDNFFRSFPFGWRDWTNSDQLVSVDSAQACFWIRKLRHSTITPVRNPVTFTLPKQETTGTDAHTNSHTHAHAQPQTYTHAHKFWTTNSTHTESSPPLQFY